MWFPANVKSYGPVDVAAFKCAVLALPEAAWCADDDKKRALAGNRPTQSIFFRYLSRLEFEQLVQDGSVREDDIEKNNHHLELEALLQPVLECVGAKLPDNGLFVRVQLARMMPGVKIDEHYDSDAILMSSYRMHIPIVTHNQLKFFVNGDRVKLQEGQLYALNNQLQHWVENPRSASLRIHLIMDFLVQDLNNASALDPRIEFTVRARNTKPPKPGALENLHLPTVIATSVVRGANREESHGGVYLVDMQNGRSSQVVDWDNCDIDFSGRGWDRGLRGIGIYENRVFIAATECIYEFDKQFNIVNSWSNPYLRHAHEIAVSGRHIYITSTGFDSILRFDIKKQVFDRGWHFYLTESAVSCKQFDPAGIQGPSEANDLHINNVCIRKDGMYISGRRIGNLLKINASNIEYLDRVPAGTHNVIPFGKGVIYNDSEGDQVVYSSSLEYRHVPVPRFDGALLQNARLGDEVIARQAFGRGLVVYEKGIVIAGSSPSTISVYDMRVLEKVKQVNISMDIRNAIHGLEVWPY